MNTNNVIDWTPEDEEGLLKTPIRIDELITTMEIEDVGNFTAEDHPLVRVGEYTVDQMRQKFLMRETLYKFLRTLKVENPTISLRSKADLQTFIKNLREKLRGIKFPEPLIQKMLEETVKTLMEEQGRQFIMSLPPQRREDIFNAAQRASEQAIESDDFHAMFGDSTLSPYEEAELARNFMDEGQAAVAAEGFDSSRGLEDRQVQHLSTLTSELRWKLEDILFT